MEKENKNVKIKVERHKWPDEISKEKKQRRLVIGIVCGLLISFGLGWGGQKLASGVVSLQSNDARSKFDRVFNDVVSSWYFSNDMEDPEQEIAENAIQGMLERNGDPHTIYMTQEQTSQLSQSINMNFVGIGVRFLANPTLNMITEVFEGSPAQQAGVMPGDIILEVDGKTITGENDEIKKMIEGEEGSSVSMKVLREQEEIELDIVRGRVNGLASGKVLGDDVAYLKVSSFGSELGKVTEDYFQMFKREGANKLVLDLRDNGGGLLTAIQDISPLLFEDDAILYQEKFKNGREVEYKVSGSKAAEYPFETITILVNSGTASASEVLTLAMQHHLDAKVVGTKTYGKGTVQTQQIYPDKTALKVTIAEWFGPDGTSINNTGITPDHEVLLPRVFYTQFPNLGENVIAVDSVHQGVQYVQEAFSYLALAPSRVDGYYDAHTVSLYTSYMNQKGLETNGSIDQAGLNQLLRDVTYDWETKKAERDPQFIKAVEVAKHES